MRKTDKVVTIWPQTISVVSPVDSSAGAVGPLLHLILHETLWEEMQSVCRLANQSITL